MELVFAMNAGMYGEDLKPIGLYVEDGQRLKKANRRDGPGNFHLKPNGVFFIDGQDGRRDGDGGLSRAPASAPAMPASPGPCW